MNKQKLLSIGSDAKTVKGEKYNYLTAILYLAPAKQSGYNVCPNASIECKKNCIFFTGRGKFKTTIDARIKKTIYYFEYRDNFMKQLKHEIDLFIKRSKKNKMIPCIRLNGTSDISWEVYKYQNGLNIFDTFKDCQFYDYSVIYKRMDKFMNKKMPENYHLTFSRKEDNQKEVLKVLKNGFNCSVVFEKYIPLTYCGYMVINGDDSDLRFLDDQNYIDDQKFLLNKGIRLINNRLPKIIGLKYKKSKGQAIDKNSFIIKQ